MRAAEDEDRVGVMTRNSEVQFMVLQGRVYEQIKILYMIEMQRVISTLTKEPGGRRQEGDGLAEAGGPKMVIFAPIVDKLFPRCAGNQE